MIKLSEKDRTALMAEFMEMLQRSIVIELAQSDGARPLTSSELTRQHENTVFLVQAMALLREKDELEAEEADWILSDLRTSLNSLYDLKRIFTKTDDDEGKKLIADCKAVYGDLADTPPNKEAILKETEESIAKYEYFILVLTAGSNNVDS